MSSKHFVNDPATLVQDALQSLTVVNPAAAFDLTNKTVYLKHAVASPDVAIVSGGGSGHEPSFGGLVGDRLLSGAVAGSIFASPSAEQVFRCLLRLGKENPQRGILVIIMNYTGDKLHFGMAVEKARAIGIMADLLIVGDDVGVGRKRSGRIGRRGLAGTVLVHKIAGFFAAEGASIDETAAIAKSVSENIATVGSSMSHVHVPGRMRSKDELDDNDEIEIGMGIHNEEGFARIQAELPSLVKQMLRQLLDTADADRGYLSLSTGDLCVLLINNLGGVSPLELGAITMEVSKQLKGTYGLIPTRVLSGTYMTSLNGLGFSITLLKVVDRRFVMGIDAPTSAPGWVASFPGPVVPSTLELPDVEKVLSDEQAKPRSNLRIDSAAVKITLTRALQRMIDAEPEVTKYDTLVGDGDCGLCLKGGAEAVLSYIKASTDLSDAVTVVASIAHVVETAMDGTSGALYAIFINALAKSLQDLDSGGIVKIIELTAWAKALNGAMNSLGKYTPARPGDRTVVDTLAPFVEALNGGQGLQGAVKEAQKGCDSTIGMEASLGRSVYVGGEDFKKCPDPGAFGLLAFLTGLAK